MKKFLLTMLLVVAFVGTCYAKTYNIKANDDAITLKKSDVVVIKLSENSSTGYSWEFKSSDENVAQIIEKKLVYPRRFKWQTPVCGQAGTAVYKIKALNSGTANIYGAYSRPWQKVSPLTEYNLKIEVE